MNAAHRHDPLLPGARRSRRTTTLFAAALAALLVVGLAACGSGEQAKDSQKLTTVRMVTSGVTLLWVHLWIADEKGFFKEEGINPEIIETPSGVTGTQAVLSGDVELGTVPLGQVVDVASQHGREIRAVAGLVTQNANTFVLSTKWAKDHGITSSSSLEEKVKALKGAKVGVVGPGSAVDDFARFVLSTYGLDPERDVQLVATGKSTAMPPALQRGEIDAYVSGSPSAEVPIVAGKAIKLISGATGDVPELAGQLFVTAVVSQKLIDQKPELVQKLVRALYKAQKFLTDKPDEARDLMHASHFKNIQDDIWKMAWQDTAPSYGSTPVIEQKGYEVNFDIIATSRGRDKVHQVPFSELVDNTFAKKAVQELG